MLTLHTCKVARKGKAAKGFIEIQTFGIPVLDEQGIARSFDYPAEWAELPTPELSVFFEQFGSVNLAMIRGFDMERRSEATKAQNETLILAARVISEELADDKETAINVAKSILDSRKKMLQIGVEPENLPSIDYLLEKRAALVDKERKAKGMSPRLIKPIEIPAEVQNDEPSEDIVSQ
jgi:hypothetical protein